MANRWVLRLPACTILTLAAFAFLSLLLPFRHFIASKASYLVIPLRNQVCPQTPLVDVQFSDHAAFQNLSHRYDRVWQDLVTPNGGFFFEKSPAGKVIFYGISMFHQLHCLGIIRSALQQAIPGHAHAIRDEAHHHGDHQDPNHMLHCVDYIRQVGSKTSSFCLGKSNFLTGRTLLR